MASKPDFAQKLLHDLRLRKERMGVSQNSTHSNSMTRDAYGNPGHRGSRQIKALESVGSKTASSHRRSSGGSRSLTIGESSNQIVPYGSSRNSQQIGDLSSAIFFALQNGGKLGKIDSSGNNSVLGFLHQIGRRPLDTGKMERIGSFSKYRPSTSQFPTLSNVHIKDISKGVQNLNQILKACSNGLNFDRYSIEVGRELLKGAIDLEESLRMLVNLQEASDYMVTPQRKNRLTLLDEDDDDEDNTMKVAEEKQLGLLPRFSFDSPARSSHGIIENDMKQKLIALTYPTDKNIRTFSTLTEPKRQSSSSKSKPEKGRISNVIAKLMGLEEIPARANVSSQKESSSKRREATTKKSEAKTRDTENQIALAIEKKALTQANKIPPTRDTSVSLKAEKSASKKDTITTDRQQINIRQPNQITGNIKVNKELDGTEDVEKQKEQKRADMSDIKKRMLNDEVQNIVQEKNWRKEKRNAIVLIPGNQQKPRENHGLKQFHQTEKREQESAKQSLQARKHKESPEKSKVSSKSIHGETSVQTKQTQMNKETSSKKSSIQPIDAPDSRHYEDTTRVGSSTKLLMNGNSDQNSSPRELRSKTDMEKGRGRPFMQEKTVPVKRNNVDFMKAHRSDTPRKIDEVMTRRNGTPKKLAKPPKHHNSVIQELKQRRHEKISNTKGGEGVTKGSNISEASNQHPNVEQKMLNVAEQPTTLNNFSGNDCQSSKVEYTLTSNDSRQNITPEVCTISNDHQGQAPALREDQELRSYKTSPNPPNGVYEGTMEITYPSKNEHRKVSPSAIQEPLTENEKNLKEILIKSQLFLNTAEALFKLNIPVGVLHGSDLYRQDNETNIFLDCGYEVMNRKGRRQELIAHPCLKISISYTKVGSLDYLVKQLNDGFERLKFYGGSDDCNAAEYLHKMLDRDIHNTDMDLNSMWDFGWSELVFAFVEMEDVIRDVEKCMLNELIDEITQDLLGVTVSV